MEKDLVINVITLNCWGLPFVSKHRRQRIKSIAQYLSEQNYDIVFLQEVWVHSDFQLIRDATLSKYEFAHLFPAKSILGTSGLAFLCKWRPSLIDYMPYTVNGTPFRPWHGDWYTGKGAGYIRIELKDLRLHLFCTHMHAQYSANENLNDQYCVHRICQSYELGKFINMTNEFVSNNNKIADLFVLAGDLNTCKNEFPFQLLESMTGLTDFEGLNKSCDLDPDELITCGHLENSFTDQILDPKDEKTCVNGHGKRIDFILYKFANKSGCHRTVECHEITGNELGFCCLAERISCSGKDPITGLSFSDHQPVAMQLKLKRSNKFFDNEDSNFDNVKTNESLTLIREFVNLSKNPILGKASRLIERYLENQVAWKNKMIFCLLALSLIVIIGLLICTIYQPVLGVIGQIVCSIIFFITCIVILVIYIVATLETNGINAILADLNVILNFKEFTN